MSKDVKIQISEELQVARKICYDQARVRYELEAQSGSTEAARDAITTVDEVEELTSFNDQDLIAFDKMAVGHSLQKSIPMDPYPDQKLSTVLSRNYEIKHLTWSGSTASGVCIGYLDLPGLLLGIANIQQTLERFRWLRAGISLKFRINSTTFHFGQLLVSWVPQYKADRLRRFQSMSQAFCHPHMIISANKREVVEMKIPYIRTELANQLDDLSGMARVGIFVLVPLNTIATTTVPTVDINVFANFEDLEVMGLYAQSGSLPQAKEADQKSKEGMDIGWKDLVKYGMPFVLSSPFGETIKTVAAVTRSADTTFRNLGLSRVDERKANRKVVQRPCSNLSHGDGIDAADKIALDPEHAIIKNPKIFGTNIDYDEIKNLVLVPNLMYGPTDFGTAATDALLLKWSVSPSMRQFWDTPNTQSSFLAQLAYSHRWWRGGMKYSIRFVTSGFTTGRVRICWTPNDLPTGGISGQEGDIVSKVVDIVGDTTVNFTIPYMFPRPYLRCDLRNATSTANALGGFINGMIGIYVTNIFVTSQKDIVPKVFMYILASGAEDMQFAIPRTMGPSALPFGTDLVAMSGDLHPRELFRQPFDSLLPGAKCIVIDDLVLGERTNRVTEMYNRYMQFALAAIPSSTDVNLSNLQGLATFSSGTAPLYDGLTDFVSMLRMFHGVRGSLRYLIVPTDININNVVSTVQQTWMSPHLHVSLYTSDPFVSKVGLNGVNLYNLLNEFAQFSVPWLSADLYTGSGFAGYSDSVTATISPFYNGVTPIQFEQWVALGEDFSLGLPLGVGRVFA